MTTIQEAPAETDDKILVIVPAQGWWVVSQFNATRADEYTYYPRDPVAVWAMVEDPTGRRVAVPMVEGDGHTLSEPDHHFFRLAHETQLGHCRCRHWPLNADEGEDIWWCRRCPGIIEPVA